MKSLDESAIFDEFYDTGQECHGELGLTVEILRGRIKRCLERHVGHDAARETIIAFIGRLYAADLYLTTACAIGSEFAWVRFLKLYSRTIAQWIRSACRNPAIAEELTNSFCTDLFMPASNGVSRIELYDGLCPLGCLAAPTRFKPDHQ